MLEYAEYSNLALCLGITWDYWLMQKSATFMRKRTWKTGAVGKMLNARGELAKRNQKLSLPSAH